MNYAYLFIHPNSLCYAYEKNDTLSVYHRLSFTFLMQATSLHIYQCHSDIFAENILAQLWYNVLVCIGTTITQMDTFGELCHW